LIKIDNFLGIENNSKIKAIQGLRAIAAIMVFNVHFFGQYGSQHYFTNSVFFKFFASFLNSGILGVEIFFVISGYFTWKKLIVNNSSRILFVKSKFIRLMPVYIAATTVIFLREFNLKEYLYELFFIKTFIAGEIYRNYVSWTLGWEWLFYIQVILISFVALKNRKYFPIYVILFFLCLILVPKPQTIAWPDLRFLSFIWGILVAEYLDVLNHRIFKLLDVLSLPLIIISMGIWSLMSQLILYSTFLKSLFFLSNGLFAALLLNTIIKNTSIYSKFLSIKPLQIVGQVSYSFFLIHPLIGIPISNKIYSNVFNEKSMLVSYVISFFVSLLVAMIFYFLFEKNILFKGNLNILFKDMKLFQKQSV
jgi:peptidoglycan/LPS O-acetylase OafA/YrhL